ncbi:hypothetical protein JHK87_037531 [Glycine soja]|nr:hypothetical protein JHK87_037531 [Glycine soja]
MKKNSKLVAYAKKHGHGNWRTVPAKALLRNKWSIIASHLSKQTKKETMNYWNTNIKKLKVYQNGRHTFNYTQTKSQHL